MHKRNEYPLWLRVLIGKNPEWTFLNQKLYCAGVVETISTLNSAVEIFWFMFIQPMQAPADEISCIYLVHYQFLDSDYDPSKRCTRLQSLTPQLSWSKNQIYGIVRETCYHNSRDTHTVPAAQVRTGSLHWQKKSPNLPMINKNSSKSELELPVLYLSLPSKFHSGFQALKVHKIWPKCTRNLLT